MVSLLQVPAALDLNAADTASLLGKTTRDALPVFEEVSVPTPDRNPYFKLFHDVAFSLYFLTFTLLSPGG